MFFYVLLITYIIFSLHSCFTDADIKHENEMDLYETIDENVSVRK